ncbi:MAG: pirin family protein [Flavobacteriaceae bacterium]|nr:pirin family protein [Flavobacteriaceae bacterium]
MKNILYRAGERGYANYNWLQANYSFSFGNYYNPMRSNFGALRVLNDDVIQGGMGFGEHPHDNMEIITIPLEGTLAHKDSMSESWVPLRAGEVQVMSAGKGIVHAEKNNDSADFINLFQIWIIPEEMEVEPAYDQMKFEASGRNNLLQILVSSYKDKQTKSLKIHQDALISRIDLSKNKDYTYNLKSNEHGVYVMLISGEITIANNILEKRDAMGIYKTSNFSVKANQNSELLFIEVPMVF